MDPYDGRYRTSRQDKWRHDRFKQGDEVQEEENRSGRRRFSEVREHRVSNDNREKRPWNTDEDKPRFFDNRSDRESDRRGDRDKNRRERSNERERERSRDGVRDIERRAGRPVVASSSRRATDEYDNSGRRIFNGGSEARDPGKYSRSYDSAAFDRYGGSSWMGSETAREGRRDTRDSRPIGFQARPFAKGDGFPFKADKWKHDLYEDLTKQANPERSPQEKDRLEALLSS